MDITEEDKVVILSDDDSKKIGEILKDVSLEITPHVRFFNLDIYGERPLSRIPEVIEDEAKNSTSTFWTAGAKKGELESVRKPFMKAAVAGGRHAHMVNITEEAVEKGLTGDYQEIDRFTNKIHSMVEDVDEVHIKTPAGTDLSAKVGTYKWVASTGMIKEKGLWHNLPNGEVYTAPYKMDGTAVIDGTIGNHFQNRYHISHIKENPITLKIENKEKPTLTDMECDDEQLLEELKEYVDQQKCSRFIGELGLGTNLMVDEFIGNMLIDEKHPGAHIALGDPIDELTFAGWSCPTHLDLMMDKCDIWFDGEKVMSEGEYLIEFDYEGIKKTF